MRANYLVMAIAIMGSTIACTKTEIDEEIPVVMSNGEDANTDPDIEHPDGD
ncbi:hypothetical protein ACW6QP_04310 [Salegentibacter sp. HM20]